MKDVKELKSVQDRYTLPSGRGMPVLALGTAGLPNDSGTAEFVIKALQMGYRHLDTAAIYGNEEAVGRGVRESGIPREEIFVTTKLANDSHGYENAKQGFSGSLKRLGLDYVDLYLIHSPNPHKTENLWQELIRQTWVAFEELYGQEKARSIGVSNFMPEHLKAILTTASIKPMVNQIKLCPGVTQDETVAYSRSIGMILTAYSPLGVGRLLDSPELKEIAEKYGRTPAQVALRWSLEMGFVPLPKTSREDRLRENMNVFDFELDELDRETLSGLKGYS